MDFAKFLIISIASSLIVLSGCHVLINPTPEISVKQDEIEINSPDGLFDFGNVVIGESDTYEFVIENTGKGTLYLTDDPEPLSIDGDGASEYVLNQADITTKLSPKSKTTFTIQYKPTELGKHHATITIESNDVDYEPYSFYITGQGVLTEINLKQDDTDIVSGSGQYDFGINEVWAKSPEVIFTIENVGTSELYLTNTSSLIDKSGPHASMFLIEQDDTEVTILPGETTTFILVFRPTRLGDKEATISISNNDTDENPYTFTVIGFGVGPDINVIDSQRNIILNKTGFFDFWDVIITTTDTEDFYIQNLGTFDLELTGSPDVQIMGPDKDAFTVIWQPLTLIMDGTESLFVIQFLPTELREYNATVFIPNSDFDESPYTYTLKGRGTEPEIEILDSNSNNIDNGSTIFDFGSINLGNSESETFTINNIGSHELELTGSVLVIINDNLDNVFEITTQPDTLIAPGDSTTFTIRFTPTEEKIYVSYIQIENNDLDENPFIFEITGAGINPEISVSSSKMLDIECNTGSFDFGSVIYPNTKSETFTITNSGSADLFLSGSPLVNITDIGVSAFTVTMLPNSLITPSNSTTFVIEFNPNSSQEFSTTVTIVNNDLDENPFVFTIYGFCSSVAEPEINVRQDAINIRNNGNYDFANWAVQFSTQDITFTIENIGTAPLSLTGSPIIGVFGANASEFTINYAMTSSSVVPNATTIFTIKFHPTSVGNKTASITIANDDSNENPYTINLLGYAYPYVKGDVNGDGIPDLVISATEHDSLFYDVGYVYVIFGRSNLPNSISTLNADVRIMGEDENDKLGYCVASAGDINNDGYHDIVISSIYHNEGSGQTGAVFIFFGKQKWDTSINVGDADVIISGENVNDEFGYSICTTGDIDDDGFDDLVVSAILNDDGGNNSGSVYIFFGKSNWATSFSAASADIKIAGENNDNNLCSSISTGGDINGDNIDDLVLGCMEYSNAAGRVYVFFGRQTWFNQISASNSDVKINPANNGSRTGCSVSCDGDVNGDGIDDLLVGAYREDSHQLRPGVAHIFFGRANWNANVDMSQADVNIEGNADNDYFGYSVRIVKDIDKDGIDEVLIGACEDDFNGISAGGAYYFLGLQSWQKDIIASLAAVVILGNFSEMYFGTSVTSGDLNGDGFVDLIVSAVNADNGSNDSTGCVYVFFGKINIVPSQTSSDADTTIEGEQKDERLGGFISSMN